MKLTQQHSLNDNCFKRFKNIVRTKTAERVPISAYKWNMLKVAENSVPTTTTSSIYLIIIIIIIRIIIRIIIILIIHHTILSGWIDVPMKTAESNNSKSSAPTNTIESSSKTVSQRKSWKVTQNKCPNGTY